MEKKVDILILGGGPAGIVSAVTARKYYPNKTILLIRNIEEGVIPCGIPYMFASLKSPDENKLGTAALGKNNVDAVVDEAIKIDRAKKIVKTKSNNLYGYEKLILAIGSNPILPTIPGIDKEGIYPIYKDMGYLKNSIEEIKKGKNVLVVGGGFIGIEFADELSKINSLNIYLVELLPHLLENSFDPEFSQLVHEKLKSKNVKILTDMRVEEFIGDGKVKRVRLSDGKEIEVDRVILGIGTVPNAELALDAGLESGKCKGVWVDEYMRTIDSDIFAIGDCSCKKDFYTRKSIPVMLASTATAEARIAGANLYQIKVVRENKGTIAIYSTPSTLPVTISKPSFLALFSVRPAEPKTRPSI